MNLQSRIDMAVQSTPTGMARTSALKAIKWRLVAPRMRLWAGLDDMGEIIPCTLPDDPQIQIFDGRDNQAMKLAFYTKATGIAWEIECVS